MASILALPSFSIRPSPALTHPHICFYTPTGPSSILWQKRSRAARETKVRAQLFLPYLNLSAPEAPPTPPPSPLTKSFLYFFLGGFSASACLPPHVVLSSLVYNKRAVNILCTIRPHCLLLDTMLEFLVMIESIIPCCRFLLLLPLLPQLMVLLLMLLGPLPRLL